MRLAVISFTRQGSVSCGKLVREFNHQGIACTGYLQEKFLDVCNDISGLVPVRQPVGVWTGERFGDSDGIIFIGAAGIAVRAVAPHLQDKQTDPAIVVADEKGTFAVSLLSGHAGGANELARMVAGILGGTPVITTATDVQQKPAIDVLAREAGLVLSDWELAKQVSAEILEGNSVGFFSDFDWPAAVPEGFTRKESCRLSVWVSDRKEPEKDDLIGLFATSGSLILRLVPPVYCVGVGCRRGTEQDVIVRAVCDAMGEYNLAPEGIRAIASIDLKKDEPGLIKAAAVLHTKFITYSADELHAVAGEFTASAFVEAVTGVNNVCERAALACAGTRGELLVRKRAANGVTVAVARGLWRTPE